MIRSLFVSLLIGATLAFAADARPPLADLTYSGDQSAVEQLDRELVAARQDPAKLAALEADLLAILRLNNTTFAARQAVCQRLGLLLVQSPPKAKADGYKPLGAMLQDDRDSDLARHALESAPGAVVDKLFTDALTKTTGRTRLGLIDSVARRQIEGAVPALAALLKGRDLAAALAAAGALGRIGGAAADQALVAGHGFDAVAVAHARLQASIKLPAESALRVLRELQDTPALPASLRAAAFRRSLDVSPTTAAARITEVLSGKDWTFKQVALESLAGAVSPETVRALVAKLATWDPPTQTGVIAALARTGDAAAVPAVVAATRHATSEVRAAALAALAFLPGNREIVTLLAQATTNDDSAVAKSARQSLAQLNGPDVSAAILAGAEKGEPALRPAYLEQIALRHMTEALPFLLKCRQETDAAVRAAAIGALGEIAPASEQKAVLAWTLAATDSTEQTKALRALVNVTLRNPASATRGTAVYAAIESASPEVALRVLPVLGRLGGSASAECAASLAVRSDAGLAKAATEALSRWTDATALGALAQVAEKAAVAAVRDAARDGAIRYLERNRDAWTAATTTLISRLAATTDKPAPRKQLVSLLARANEATALTLSESLQSDPALANDARYAATVIKVTLARAPKVRASPASGAANMLDGKTSSRWSTPLAGEEWIEVDFGQSRPLRRLTLDQTGRAAEFPEKYEVHVCADPKQPGPVVVSGQGQRNKTVIELPAGTEGRYVVIKNTVERKETPWAVCELYVD